ncbi:MAG: 50S ribosomal protein L32 [Puniceicoccales bacterium]|jgi:large subunit ribosomal protein L32|nr:50S ribosomal protein L32 [Puniceicoccales bacterium]
MAQPKRKQSKQRSRKRRGAHKFIAPQFSVDKSDGTLFRPHYVNPENGIYRGRQVIEFDDDSE